MKMYANILCTKETVRDTETADVQLGQVFEETETTKLINKKHYLEYFLNFKKSFLL